MISGVSSVSALSVSAVSMMHSKQILALEARVASLESQIMEKREMLVTLNQNSRLTSEQRMANTEAVNEQIARVREQIAEVRTQISQAHSRQRQAENEARRRQQAARERAEQMRPEREEEQEEVIDGKLVHAIIKVSSQQHGLPGRITAQLNSRRRTASQEDIWRKVHNPDTGRNLFEEFRNKGHGTREIIPIENRRPRNPEEAHDAQSRIQSAERAYFVDQADKIDTLRNAGASQPQRPEQGDEEQTLQELEYTKDGLDVRA